MESSSSPTKRIGNFSLNQIFLAILVVSVLLGVSAGYLLSSSKNAGGLASSTPSKSADSPKTAQQDKSTFKDFAEGTIQKKEASKKDNYSEGTHILVRTGAVPVTLTSSVVDLEEYEGKKVVVYGQTLSAVKAGWLMDVGLVEIK